MIVKQTHATVSGTPAVALPGYDGVFFLGGDAYVTAWAAAKHETSLTAEKTDVDIDVTNEAMRQAREAIQDYQVLARRRL